VTLDQFNSVTEFQIPITESDANLDSVVLNLSFQIRNGYLLRFRQILEQQF
jgi:hypothetical protein